MEETTNPVVSEVAANNPYLQQELDLSQKIREALESSTDVTAALEALQKARSTKQRNVEELEKFRENKTEIENALLELKRSFGNSDSFEDQKKYEDYEFKLKNFAQTIPLLEKKFEPNSVLSREIEDCVSALIRAIDKTLLDLDIQTQLQRDMDVKVNDLLQNYFMYQSALKRVQTELPAITKEVQIWKNLREILPKVEGLGEITGDFYKGAMLASAGRLSGNQVPGDPGQVGPIALRQPAQTPPRQVDPSTLKDNILKR